MHIPSITRRSMSLFAAIALAGTLGAGLSACGEEAEPDPTSAGQDAANDDAAGGLSITDPWIKVADDGMTAAFGTLVNSSDSDITVVSAASEVATEMQLHSMSMDGEGEMTMQEVDGGFVIPAGGEYVLEPGGNHLMVMGLTRPIAAGETVTITLTLEDGTTMDLTAVGKNFSGANEEYVGDDESGDSHGSHGGGDGDDADDMDDMEHEDGSHSGHSS